MMRRADTCQQTIGRPKVAAVHSDVANPARGVLSDEGTGHTGVTAEPWLLHRRREDRQTDFFQLHTNVNLFVYGTAFDDYGVNGLIHRVAPALIDFSRVLATHSQPHDFSRCSVDAGEHLDSVPATLAVCNVLIQKGLPFGVRATTVLQPHERHQLAVLIDQTLPPVE